MLPPAVGLPPVDALPGQGFLPGSATMPPDPGFSQLVSSGAVPWVVHGGPEVLFFFRKPKTGLSASFHNPVLSPEVHACFEWHPPKDDTEIDELRCAGVDVDNPDVRRQLDAMNSKSHEVAISLPPALAPSRMRRFETEHFVGFWAPHEVQNWTV